MAIRRGWEALSEKYRSRLVKGGMTQARYEAGESLKAVRGHRATPENLKEAKRHPEKFQAYNERRNEQRRERNSLIGRVIEKKRAAFQHTLRFDEANSREFVRHPKRMVLKININVKPPTLKQLRQVDGMTVEELIDFQYEVKEEDDWRMLWYH
jgi:hypothetical protein